VEETDEEGDTEQIPVTHALFIRDSEVATLPQAPYHRRENATQTRLEASTRIWVAPLSKGRQNH
ncbi:MAG: hypothetical protein ACKPKO_34835, partial [Candidatus Fonsibacter sp.]